MSLAQTSSERTESDRRDHIIAAAERAFVRHGFHSATMHQVAEEAGMSAGNLYRYFSSKEALVEGLCEAGHRERSTAFAALIGSDDLLATLAQTLRDHLLARPRESAMLFMEMNAEAAHNPRIADMTLAIDAGVLSGLARLIDVAKERGEAAASLDPDFAARLIFTMVGGLMKRRALEPDFDIDREATMTFGVVKALFAGAIAPSRSLTEGL
ncbi:MAG: TetR/AcrR family transcriptional regulator [Hyphomicrobiales bacterium]|nr:TetR/AcrR family transcriptional regulator [Hyphomicrobiales bacterium]